MITRFLTFLALIFITNISFAACDKVGSSDVLDATVQDGNMFNDSEGAQDNCQEISNSNLGYVIENCVFKIDLNHPNFSSLVQIGGWMNGYNIGLDMLFLRIYGPRYQFQEKLLLKKS